MTMIKLPEAERRRRGKERQRAKYAHLTEEDHERRRVTRRTLNSTVDGWITFALVRAKSRAKKLDLDFNLSREDVIIPERCPVLDTPLILGLFPSWSGNQNAPSLDRVDNTKGYVKGNVRVISTRANILKKDATLKEVEGIVAYMKSALGESE